MATVDIQPIPCPPGWPLIGNVLEIEEGASYKSVERLWKQYGDIYLLNFIGRHLVVVSSRELATEVLDEKRFHKCVQGTVLELLRDLSGDALFTAYHGEKNWSLAHKMLVPAFGPMPVLNMFDDMYDICSQMILKWDRFGPKHPIDVCKDLTRLTFDTIALCAMDYRLNSFYQENDPPFIHAMNNVLVETSAKFKRPSLVTAFMSQRNQQLAADIQLMKDFAREIVTERRSNPNDRKDLLNAMLNGSHDGKGLTDESIVEQLITFLVAGHDIGFLLLNIMQHPDAYAKLQAEIDDIVGKAPMQPAHVNKLPYLIAVMRETIRLTSTAPGIGVCPDQDEIVGGKFLIPKGQPIFVSIYNIHRDPAVWGDDADLFKPERMLDGKFEALPPKAFLAFGNGARACIGRSFAWQETQIAVTTMLQRFDFKLADRDYKLKIKQALTIKPADLFAYAVPRKTSFSLNITPSATPSRAPSPAPPLHHNPGVSKGETIHILYGSNTGSCETFAQRIASDAPHHGFNAIVETLDSASSNLPTDGPVVILSSSFEGEPPDNARRFIKFIEGQSQTSNKTLSRVKYIVFGCGNHDWVQTYQRVPRLVDDLLEKCGAQRLMHRGEADAGSNAFFDAFDLWEEQLWVALKKIYNPVVSTSTHLGLEVELLASGARASRLRQDDTGLGVVLSNVCLSKNGVAEKRHLEIQLPDSTEYRAGDYVGILGHNPPQSVKRALARFSLAPDQEITISSSVSTTLPVGRPIGIAELLSGYLELWQPATRKNIEVIVEHSGSDATRSSLATLLEEYSARVLVRRLSVLNILEQHSDVHLPLGVFLNMLPAMRVRQYSISSSPLEDHTRAALTFGVLREPSLNDAKDQFYGVASNYLAGLEIGDRIQVAVRSSSSAFHLPADCTTPIVLFASGSGIAPMRGFIQERAVQHAAGRRVGKTTLFFGCRSPNLDFLYSDTDFKAWTEAGLLEVHPAFSRESQASFNCRYVQHRMWYDRSLIAEAFKIGARFYTCGSLRVAQGIKDTFIRILDEHQLCDAGLLAEEMWARLQNQRYAADVFN
ncbi:cytochrome P450 [Auriculariales sp. MPI-PUGE-AT-0066]|nr:cytochrome P450 [Auriculariales sp. MPI-PUGE-AT-0066]